MRKSLLLLPLFAMICSSQAESPNGNSLNTPKAENNTTISNGKAAIIRDSSGLMNVDLYIDDFKIATTRDNTITFISVPSGLHYVILDVFDTSHSSIARCIDTFQFRTNDTTAIVFKPVMGKSMSAILYADIQEISKPDFQKKKDSGRYETAYYASDSIFAHMKGSKYSRLLCEHAGGARFIKKTVFDFFCMAMNFGFSNDYGTHNAINISNGKNIEAEVMGMFSRRWGLGLRIGYFGDYFVMGVSDPYYSTAHANIRLSQMEYTFFTRIATAKPASPNLFIEPGIGFISGSSKSRISYDDYYYGSHIDSAKADINRFCFSAHTGVLIGLLEFRLGFYYSPGGDSDVSIRWYNVNMGVNLAGKSKSKCKQ